MHTFLWENDSECLRLGVADTIKTCSSSNQNDNPLCPVHPSPLPSPLLPCGNRSERPFPPIKIPLSIPPLGERDSGESFSTIGETFLWMKVHLQPQLVESPSCCPLGALLPIVRSPSEYEREVLFAEIREGSACCMCK